MAGETIGQAAYALPPLTPSGLGAGVEAVSIFLAIVTTIVVCLRVWVRAGFSGAGTRVWGVDDYLLLLGFVCTSEPPPAVKFPPRLTVPLWIATIPAISRFRSLRSALRGRTLGCGYPVALLSDARC